VELFYGYRLTPAITIKPDVQYIANPGGAGRDALAVGVRFELSL
jgi:porin